MAKVIIKGKHIVRLTFVNIGKPRKDSGKYSICCLLPKSDKEMKKKLDEAIEQTKEDDSAKWGGKIPSKLHYPIHDGDEEKSDDYPEYEGMWYFNASSDRQPEVLDMDGEEMLNLDDLYNGCWAKVSINFAGYNVNGNRGIGVFVNNIKKAKDDKRLCGGYASADDDFADDDNDDLD